MDGVIEELVYARPPLPSPSPVTPWVFAEIGVAKAPREGEAALGGEDVSPATQPPRWT